MKTVKFYTVGCKVNQYETQAIREQFIKAGFQELDSSLPAPLDSKHLTGPADVYIINTCTVTHRADRDSFNLIRRAHRENSDARIIVTGCLIEFDADKITAIPGVSLIVKNRDKFQTGITHFKNHTRAFLKVQDGCNYLCSYCKARLARGRSRSKPLSSVQEEAEILVRNGYKEIVLCGICLGSYGRDLVPESSLTGLVQELERINGNFRIRLSSIEAGDITNELIGALTKSKRLCRHLHVPVQSGDDRILKLMNRQYSRDDYIKLIRRLKDCIPEIAITTDVMVGFPGETSASFGNTVELIRQIQPVRVHIFPYSKRKNTPAFSLGESIPELEIKSRMEYLGKIVQKTRLAYCQRHISRIANVLVERPVQGSPDLWEGYTDTYIKVRIKSNLDLKNKLVKAKLRKIYKDFVLADIA